MAANKLADSDVHPAVDHKDLDNLKSSISISEFIAYVGVSPISSFFFRSPCSVSFFLFRCSINHLLDSPPTNRRPISSATSVCRFRQKVDLHVVIASKSLFFERLNGTK
jgi:hypothetical protein